jgi:hypothetical protein
MEGPNNKPQYTGTAPFVRSGLLSYLRGTRTTEQAKWYTETIAVLMSKFLKHKTLHNIP